MIELSLAGGEPPADSRGSRSAASAARGDSRMDADSAIVWYGDVPEELVSRNLHALAREVVKGDGGVRASCRQPGATGQTVVPYARYDLAAGGVRLDRTPHPVSRR